MAPSSRGRSSGPAKRAVASAAPANLRPKSAPSGFSCGTATVRSATSCREAGAKLPSPDTRASFPDNATRSRRNVPIGSRRIAAVTANAPPNSVSAAASPVRTPSAVPSAVARETGGTLPFGMRPQSQACHRSRRRGEVVRRQSRVEHRVFDGAAQPRGERGGTFRRDAEDAAEPRQNREVGAQLGRERRPGEGAGAGQRAGRQIDREAVHGDPARGFCQLQQKPDPVAEERGEAGREQRCRCRRAGEPQGGLAGDRELEPGVDPGARTGRDGEPAAPIGKRPRPVEGHGQRQAVAGAEQPSEQEAARLARPETHRQSRFGTGKPYGQRQIAGMAVDPGEIDRRLSVAFRDRGMTGKRGGDRFAEHRRRQADAADREPIEGHRDRQQRQPEKVVWRGCRSAGGGKPGEIDGADRQGPDLHAPGKECRGPHLDGDIAQAHPGAEMVGDHDPFDREAERHEAGEPGDRKMPISGARRGGEALLEPGPAARRLDEAERDQRQEEGGAERLADPPQPTQGGAHQKA